MTKRILSAMMCAVILFSLTEVSGAYATSPEFDLPETDTGYIEEVTGTDENEIVDYIDENVDVILLPEDGSMPDYIKYAEFDDGSVYIADGYGDVSEIPDQADEAWDDDMIPIKFPPLSAEGAFESTGIELCADIDTAPVHIQIYDDENDVSVFDADFPILESEIITLIEDKEYSISLVFDYGDFARGYYGSISVIDGNVEELGAWEITTERVVPDDVDSAVESYDSIVNEREPNNSYGSATNYKNNDDMYGTISSASDVDYYKVDFGRDGKANFYLGNIPEDCNYDLKIYSQPVSGGTPVLYRTLSTSKDYEQVQNLPVESNKVYYMQVYSQNKTYSSNSKYQVRAKITPSDDNYGSAQNLDYYDYDIFLHEMGHWIMRNMGGRPAGDGVNHTWGTPSNPRTAYIEGWAHYFSAIMRDEPTVYDYDSTGHYFGGNLKTGYVKASSSSSHTEKIEKQTPYSKNMEYEANVGSALWNLSDKYSTYREMERVMKNPRANWQEFYDAYMNNITANEEGAWNICENFNIAFDLEVPQVTLFISDNIASMTASDNVAVKSYEWYVDGSLVSSGNGASSSIALNALGLNSGTHTVECRVYDAEGLASGDRPRQERYGSASKSFQIVGGSELLNENISDKLPELSPIENAESVVSEAMVLSVGEEQQQAIITPGNMDIVIQMAAKGAIRSIDIISPDGKLYDTLYHIAPDAPYKISNAQAGEWTMIISAFTEEDVAALPRVQGSVIDSQDTVINSTVDMQLQISLMPSPVEIDIPNITADSYILEEFLADESIVVTENDQTLDKSLPLEDGIHELCVVREIDGLISEAREYSVTVDTTPPELSFADLPNETNRDRVVLFVNCSEAMSDLMINGTSVELFDCGAGDEYNDVYLLDHGDNYFDITVTDLAGNSSSQTICVTRTS